MITEKFDEQTGLLISHWTGEVSLDEIVDYIRRTKENKDYPRKLKILTYSKHAKLSLGLEELRTISEENRQSVANYEFIADAFIMEEALVAAISSMYQHVSQAPYYYFKVFSTEAAALIYLTGY